MKMSSCVSAVLISLACNKHLPPRQVKHNTNCITLHNAKTDCEAKAGEIVWGVGSEWIRIWLPKLADFAQSEYHDVFSLEPRKLGCTHLTEHVFKERFRQIPLQLVEEVHTHLWEMLDSVMIHPSQSAWCNAVVLVWKKDGGLCFCIDFHHLNGHTKKTVTHFLGSRKHWRFW